MDVPLLELMKDNSGYDRTFKRYRLDFPVLVRPAPQEPESRSDGLPGLVQNLSLSGLSFACIGSFAMTSLVEIEITFESQTYLLLALVRWRWRLDSPDGPMYHYGAQFQRTEAVLQFIPAAAQFLLAQGSERRAPHGDAVASIPLRTRRQVAPV